MPKLLKTPFAIDATEGFRTDIQESTGVAPNSATYQVGFPPVTMQSIASNGMPPKGSDLNGVLYDITDNLVFLTQGGGYGFDSAYATSIGGYPLNARLRLTNGDIVKSTTDGNLNDPSVDMAGWKFDNVVYVDTIADMLALTRFYDGMRVYVDSYNPVNYALAVPYFAKGGGLFEYDSSKSAVNDYGHVLNGWVRIGWESYNPTDFGAYGNWNGSTQQGNDDTLAIQRCSDACINSENNFRSGGKRSIDFDTGNYYLTVWNIPRINWFDLTVTGHGQVQLWIKGVGNVAGGIINNLEGTKWKNITFNGFEGAAGVYPPIFGVNDLQYVMKCYLTIDPRADVDILFDGCSVHWCKEFALVRGRGFTFRNGNWIGIQGALCVIDCDPSLVFETVNQSIMNSWFDTGMRHYRVQNSRGDGSRFVIRVQGTAACKEYIHDVVISDCAIVNNDFGIIYAPDARLISPKIIDNYFAMCIRGFHCKAVVNAVDSGNTWTNNGGTDASHYSATNANDGIGNLHIIDNVDGIYIGGKGSTYKQIVTSVLYIPGTGGICKNVIIEDGNYSDFGDVSRITGHFIKFDNTPSEFSNIKILHNNVKSSVAKNKLWTSHNPTGTYENDHNITDGNFPNPELSLVNTLASGITHSHRYKQEGNYILGTCHVVIPAAATGAVGNIVLPIQAKPFDAGLTSQLSSTAQLGSFSNAKTVKFLTAGITVSNGITLQNTTDGVNLDVSHLTPVTAGQAMSFLVTYRYKFKT